MAPVIDVDRFPIAERCALRLDGDCFEVGLSVVPVDVPVGASVRAASLAAATGAHDLVAELWTAAWVHGAWHRLPTPVELALDLGTTRRTRALRPAPRERRFGPQDVERLGGVRVTTPFRTAFDLVLRHGDDPATASTAAALLAGRSAQQIRDDGLALRGCNGKHAAIDRLLRLAA